jgi:CRP/FNR family transcriptional regulator, dissimilatory nitrate respiration regulator
VFSGVLGKRRHKVSNAPPDPAPGLHQLGLTREDMAVVRGLPLFQGMSDHVLAHLLGGGLVRSYERRTLLFLQGEEASRLFVVLDGAVRLFRSTADGQDSTIALLGPGESLAEAAIFDGGRYPVNACVAEPGRLLVVPAASFLARLRENPDLALNLLAAMSRHLRRLVAKIEQLSSYSALERVTEFLLRLCPADQGGVEIALPQDKVLIAARLNMQPETLSRALARLRAHGVTTVGSRVIIADVERLRRLAQR